MLISFRSVGQERNLPMSQPMASYLNMNIAFHVLYAFPHSIAKSFIGTIPVRPRPFNAGQDFAKKGASISFHLRFCLYNKLLNGKGDGL